MRAEEEFLKKVESSTEKDYGLCWPPISSSEALRVLKDHFLGPDWYSVMPQSSDQINTEMVYEILKNNSSNNLFSFIDNIIKKKEAKN